MIPIVPMPFPCPDWDPVIGAGLRASDADRDVAADILCAAVADGRLTLAELDQRLEEVLSARTLRELARRISDVAGPRCSDPVQPDLRMAANPKPAARPQPPAGTRWALLQSLLGPAGGPSRSPT